MKRDSAGIRGDGLAIAAVLSGAWRPLLPDPPPTLESLTRVLPQLLATGAGPLAWRRIRDTPVAHDRALAELRNAYRRAALNARRHEVEIARVVGGLQCRGLRPLLVKGWAVARRYPEPALRPYGDLDLLFAPDEQPEATRILETLASPEHPVEIHAAGIGAYRVLAPADWNGALQRCETANLNGTPIRIPAPEDHFRILCSHLLAHGAWRPLWLCDLAALIEQQAGTWNWATLLRGPDAANDWLRACLRLSADLLGASLAGVPPPNLPPENPSWIADTVLRQWGLGTGGSRREALSLPLLQHLGARGGLREELIAHWPNPIQAGFERGLPVTSKPPTRAQLTAASGRVPRLLRSLLTRAPR